MKNIADRTISYGWCEHCKAKVRLQWDPMTGYVIPAHKKEYPPKEVLMHKISFCPAETYGGFVSKEET